MGQPRGASAPLRDMNRGISGARVERFAPVNAALEEINIAANWSCHCGALAVTGEPLLNSKDDISLFRNPCGDIPSGLRTGPERQVYANRSRTQQALVLQSGRSGHEDSKNVARSACGSRHRDIGGHASI